MKQEMAVILKWLFLFLACANCVDLNCFLIHSNSLNPNDINFRLPELNIPGARHHIVPRNRLATFFNTGIQHNADTRDAVVRILLSIFHTAVDFFNADLSEQVRREIENLNSETMEEVLNVHENPWADNRRYTIRIIQTLFVWMPFNIFIGPMFRDDDPGGVFEINSIYIVGSAAYSQLQTIDDSITHYLNNDRNSPGLPQSVANIRTAVNWLVDYAPTGYGFRPDNWELIRIENGYAYWSIEENENGSFPNEQLIRKSGKRYFTVDTHCLNALANLQLRESNCDNVLANYCARNVKKIFNKRDLSQRKGDDFCPDTENLIFDPAIDSIDLYFKREIYNATIILHTNTLNGIIWVYFTKPLKLTSYITNLLLALPMACNIPTCRFNRVEIIVQYLIHNMNTMNWYRIKTLAETNSRLKIQYNFNNNNAEWTQFSI